MAKKLICLGAEPPWEQESQRELPEPQMISLPHWESSTNTAIVPDHSNIDSPKVGNAVLVPRVAEDADRTASDDTSSQNHFDSSSQLKQSAPLVSKVATSWVSCIRSVLQKQGIGQQAIEIMLNSWRNGTKKQYTSSISQWTSDCKLHNYNPTTPPVAQVLEFLTHQSNHLGYSAIGTTRSTLSSFITLDVVNLGDHPLVERFMAGLFNRKPALPRYVETWNPHIVLDYFKSLPENESLELKQLTMKLTVLLALISAQRLQTLKALSLDGMSNTKDSFSFRLLEVLKQTSRHGGKNRHLAPIVLKKYPHDSKLSPVRFLKEYLTRTATLRTSQQLLLCYNKPPGPASRDTICRWRKQTLAASGVNTTVFKAHSCHSAATSAAKLARSPDGGYSGSCWMAFRLCFC